VEEFVWQVAVDGYEWDGAEYERCLFPAGPWRTREYQPLKEFSGLFRTFAATPPTEEGILAFANQYGHLGAWPNAPEEFPDGTDELDTEEELAEYLAACEKVIPDEPFEAWVEEIRRVRACLERWDRVQRGEGGETDLLSVQNGVDLGIRFSAQARLLKDRRRGGLTIQIMPENLLGAIWLQFAEAVSGNKKYRACATCGRWYELSPDKARADSVYCREACRSRAYRARKEKAVQLAGEGKTPKQIAADLGSDAKTVRGWLKRKEK
jgi:hypothetical protein